MQHLDILGEFLGTLVLILLGNGVGMSVSLKRMFANQSGRWLMITFGWAFAVLMGVIVASSLGAPGHINPAVSLFALFGDKKIDKFFAYSAVQILGAFSGQIILYIINYKHIKETDDYAIIRSCSSTSGGFSNFKEKGLAQNLMYEYVATLVLIGIIFALGKGENKKYFESLGPIPVVLLISSLSLSLGSVTGYAMNPARDLGPRVAFQLFSIFIWKQKKINGGWDYSFVPIISPLLAGTTIGLFSLI
ncbi:MIP/aquaporin family protein [Mesomycoplasma neurolyticum]|uniref:Aquaglyceroporin n=1 Tax=Mesomycoplasma neurolyticum TaxID=2120 RepID=A0A449A5J3_9BACT|nr:MIP/aquaporin family protein [Mesomycoplasma neurolyticum]VEU59499.1 Aquaglyceroporin [Mesomycoplasma neurolyticum]